MVNTKFKEHGITNYKASTDSKVIKASWFSKIFGGKDKTVYFLKLEGSGEFNATTKGTLSIGDEKIERSTIANGAFGALKNVVNSETVHNFHYTEEYKGEDLSTGYGGGFAPRFSNNFYVSPKGNQKTMSNWQGSSPAAIFFHEIVHVNNNYQPGVPQKVCEGYAPNFASRVEQVMNPWKFFVKHK